MPCKKGVRLLRYRFSPFRLGYVERIQCPGSRPDPRRRRILVDGTHTAFRHTPTLSLFRMGLQAYAPPKNALATLPRNPWLIMPATEFARKRAHRKRHKIFATPACPKSHRPPNGATIRPITMIPVRSSTPTQAAIPDQEPDRPASLMTTNCSGKSVVPSEQPFVLHMELRIHPSEQPQQNGARGDQANDVPLRNRATRPDAGGIGGGNCNAPGRTRTSDPRFRKRESTRIGPHSQTGIGGRYATSTLPPNSSTTPNESDTGCRDLKPDLKAGRLNSARQLIDRGVTPDVADFLVRCATADRVAHVIDSFDRHPRPPADSAAWFQEMLLHDTHDRNLSRFGQRIRQAPKSTGLAKRQPLPKGRRRRARKRKLRRPAA